MAVTVNNTSASLAGKTLVKLEDGQTFTGLKTFDLGAAPPFAVGAGAAAVPNLDADKLDGQHGASYRDATLLTGVLKVGHGGTGIADIPSQRIPYGATVDAIQTHPGFWFDGNILGLPGQIRFPATQNASADPNTLDDYEEGNFTPVIGGNGGTSGQTYSTQVGRYVKIGRRVLYDIVVALSNKGTITGGVEIQGMPFQANGYAYGICSAVVWSGMASNFYSMSGWITPLGQTITILGLVAAGPSSALGITTTNLSNTSQFIISGSYESYT